jgi:hypothetical protein
MPVQIQKYNSTTRCRSAVQSGSSIKTTKKQPGEVMFTYSRINQANNDDLTLVKNSKRANNIIINTAEGFKRSNQ